MKTTNRNLPKPPRRKNRGNWNVPAVCPGCTNEGTLVERLMPSSQLIGGEEIHCEVTKWTCKECDAAFMSPAQATESVKRAVTAYQLKHDLLTAAQIREGRKKKGLSVSELAHEADLGVATIKRIEAGTTVQRLGTNTLLLTVFNHEDEVLPDYEISLDCKDFAVACSVALSKWKDEVPWNLPDPWNSQSGADSMMYCAADSNELALAV